MNDVSKLKQRAEKLTQQIGLMRTELHAEAVGKKADAVEREIRELRNDKERLARENTELQESLKSLITAVEDSRLTEWNDGIQGIGKKMDAMLDKGRAGDVSVEAVDRRARAYPAAHWNVGQHEKQQSS